MCVLLLTLSALTASAQSETPPADTIPADTVADRVSLLTCAPGYRIYELEGHSALRLQLGDSVDVVVNWGIFDFNSPGFVYRFVKGETDYMCALEQTTYFLNQYRREGRRVTGQQLNLTRQQIARLRELVYINLQPQNRVYRYNYVLDNCATRPLQLVERAIGDTLILGSAAVDSLEVRTFRNAMRSFHASYPWYQFGIDICLGSLIDTPIAPRAFAFAPVSLEQMLAQARLPDGSPAIVRTEILVDGPANGMALDSTPWWATPLFVAWVLFGIAVLLSLWDIATGNRSVAGRLFDTIVYGAYGLAGSLVLFLICISVHYAASPNWLVLWLNPLCLVAAVGVWLKKTPDLVYYYQILNFAALIAMAVVWMVSLQDYNPAFVPLLLIEAIRAVTYVFVSRCTPRKKQKYRVNYYAP